MRDTRAYTADDVQIRRFTTDWGSDAATLLVTRDGYYRTHVYSLHSTWGMEGAKRGKDSHYLVNETYGEASAADNRPAGRFLGSLPTDQLEQAIELMLAELTLWAIDRDDREAIGPAVEEMQRIIGDLDGWDPVRAGMTLRDRWGQLRQVMTRMEMTMFQPVPGSVPTPTPPSWPWYSRVALLDTPSSDWRILASSGRYNLPERGGPVPLFAPAGGHESVPHLGTLDALEVAGDGWLWAFGTAHEQSIAGWLCAGVTFASITLSTEPAERLSEGDPLVWVGGTIIGAVVLPMADHPWRPAMGGV